jgi:hypothetical protein
MSPEFLDKWEELLEGVDKEVIPLEFIKKIIFKLRNRRRHSVNIERLLKQGLEFEEIEDIITEKLVDLDDAVLGVEFILNVESIADTVQPETDKVLSGL